MAACPNPLHVFLPSTRRPSQPRRARQYAELVEAGLLIPLGPVSFRINSWSNYNPTKDNAGVPATWHWDEFNLSPSVPFTMIKSPTRIVEDETPVHFNAPAPANAYLRFSATASSAQVSAKPRSVAGRVPS